jgi:uncharacterized protein (TIGR03382 family)
VSRPWSPDAGALDGAVVRGTENDGDAAVAFIAQREGRNGIGNVCSGTLIDAFATSRDHGAVLEALHTGGATPPRFILTARHCIRNSHAKDGKPAGWVTPPEDILVFFAAEPDLSGTSHRVIAHRVHPKTDLAVLELAEPVMATPVPLNREDLEDFVGAPLRVAGFGVTATGARDAGVKRVGSAELVSASTAGVVQSSTRAALDQNGDVAVVGPGPNGQTICAGDSGGPEFLPIDGVEYVASVTSFSYGPPIAGQQIPDCTHPDTVAGVVRVDKNIDWIQAFVRERGGAPALMRIEARAATGCASGSGAASFLALLLTSLFVVVFRRLARIAIAVAFLSVFSFAIDAAAKTPVAELGVRELRTAVSGDNAFRVILGSADRNAYIAFERIAMAENRLVAQERWAELPLGDTKLLAVNILDIESIVIDSERLLIVRLRTERNALACRVTLHNQTFQRPTCSADNAERAAGGGAPVESDPETPLAVDWSRHQELITLVENCQAKSSDTSARLFCIGKAIDKAIQRAARKRR